MLSHTFLARVFLLLFVGLMQLLFTAPANIIALTSQLFLGGDTQDKRRDNGPTYDMAEQRVFEAIAIDISPDRRIFGPI